MSTVSSGFSKTVSHNTKHALPLKVKVLGGMISPFG